MTLARVVASFTVAGLLPAVASLFAAGSEPRPGFRLVSAETSARLERRLQSAAEEGYRLVAADQGVDVTGRPRVTVLLERTEESYTYRVLACSGDLRDEETRGALASLGTEGYYLRPRAVTARKLEEHWLPESAYADQMVLILERGAGRRRYAFDSLAFGDYAPFYRDLGQRRRDGFEVVGIWNTGRMLQLILQKRQDEAAPGGGTLRTHRLLLKATRLVLATKLEASADEGFRILAAGDPSITGPPVILLEQAAASGNAVDYKFLDDVPVKQMKDKLQKKLNKKAKQGWRVAARGTTAEVITLERKAKNRTTTAEYLVLSSRHAPGLPRSLEDATRRGFVFVNLFVEPDETTVLLEKIHPAE